LIGFNVLGCDALDYEFAFYAVFFIADIDAFGIKDMA